MPRYFFNVFGTQDIFDEVGTELANKTKAQQQMLVIAMRIVEKIELTTSCIWQIEALNAVGKIVGTATFRVEVEQRSKPQHRC